MNENNLEVLPKEDKLVRFAGQTGLETTKAISLAEVFRPIYQRAQEAIAAAAGVAESVKDATCVREIKKSRACRLALRSVRLESEETRKREKAGAVLYGKAVDGFHNILLADISPLESALQDAEDTAERAEAARLSTLKADREAELKTLDCTCLGDLSTMSDADYAAYLADAKLLKQAKIDAAKAAAEAKAKAAAEAAAKAEADRIERERIASENARLKAEADAREAAAKAEREAAARKLAEQQAAAEAAAKAQREAAAAKLAEERAAAKAAADAAAEKARKEREAVEAKAREERAIAEAAAKKEQARLKAIAYRERRKLAAAEAEAKRLRDAEEKRQAESDASARKAEAAPDNAKAQSFADALRALPRPAFRCSPQFAPLGAKVEALAKWIESQIESGGLL